jgi:diguanylate cyclase (GGDEF)-like protein
MTDERDDQSIVEVVEHLEEDQIDLTVVHWVAGEKDPSPEQLSWLAKLHDERGEEFYSDLIFILLGRRYHKQEAHVMWDRVLSHRDSLTQTLGRNPGVVVAALDWQTNFQDDDNQEFNIIESDKLDDVLERAVVDGLTGLYDHETMLMLLEKELERARRHSEKCALLMLDLDDFKRVNDEYGHQKGDEVLVRLADIMLKNLRTMDTAGRFGGEEFIAILPETDSLAAIRSGERLRIAVEKEFSHDIGLTVSIGLACFPSNAVCADALLKKADDALYQAKDKGKNRVVSFSETN